MANREHCHHENVVTRTDFFIYPIRASPNIVIKKLMRGTHRPNAPHIYANE